MRRRGALTEADRTDWARFANAIAPLRGRAPVLPPPELPTSESQATPGPPRALAAPAIADTQVRRATPASVAIGGQPAGLDTASWLKFRGGKLTATRRLDLHGMTAQHAYHALLAFLRTAHADRLRCVEVVTGRGSGEGGGVIRREFPMWLNLPTVRPMILAASHPHAANHGSVRLLLRRIR